MPDLPNGLLTLVFTDAEGSTQLVRRLGDTYAQLLDDHRRLMRDVVAEAGGHVVDHRGAGFSVVFSDAGHGAGAPVQAQLAFAAHEWPDGVELRVRMGMHTGEPTCRDGTYYGLDGDPGARSREA